MLQHDHKDLIKLFNNLFESTENTILMAGGEEPLYLPQDELHPTNRIIFTQDYYSSALHEIAHWCIAGKDRRKLRDYGYWYNPQRASIADQQLFEQIEAKPQAIEWIFSAAAGIRFNISVDNLMFDNQINNSFKESIYLQTLKYLTDGLPFRAEKFKQAILTFYQRGHLFDISLFNL